MSSTDTSKKCVQRDDFATHAIGQEIPANYIIEYAKGLILNEKVLVLLGTHVFKCVGPMQRLFQKWNRLL
jgi:hypothetical protein